jgi:hypothetical protein
MLGMAKGMTPQELEFNFTKAELYSLAQELNIKGRSQMDKTVLALNVEEQLNEQKNFNGIDPTGYSIQEKPLLKGTDFIDYDEYFKMKYGLTELEAQGKMRALDLIEYRETDLLEAFYCFTCGCEQDEAQGYMQNDVDSWNDYKRDWEQFNPQEEIEPIEVMENPSGYLGFSEIQPAAKAEAFEELPPANEPAEEVAVDPEEVGAAAWQLLKELKEELLSTEEGEDPEPLNDSINCCLELLANFESKNNVKLGGI